MKIKKFCSYCNQNMIDEDEKACDECKERYNIKDTSKKRSNESFDRDEWHKEYKEFQDIYNHPHWEIVRERAISRQLGLCAVCYSMGRRTIRGEILHHIIPLRDNKSQAYKLDNLIFVCPKCHAKIHSIYDTNKDKKVELQKQLRIILQNIVNSFKFHK